VSVSFEDSQGNTPLHYAAKYGHDDLCRHLVQTQDQYQHQQHQQQQQGSGSLCGRLNAQRQSAYDVAESHKVRQFLLPLVLASEREREGAAAAAAAAVYGGAYPSQQMQQQQYQQQHQQQASKQ